MSDRLPELRTYLVDKVPNLEGELRHDPDRMLACVWQIGVSALADELVGYFDAHLKSRNKTDESVSLQVVKDIIHSHKHTLVVQMNNERLTTKLGSK